MYGCFHTGNLWSIHVNRAFNVIVRSLQYAVSDYRRLAPWIVQDWRNEKKWKVSWMERKTDDGEKLRLLDSPVRRFSDSFLRVIHSKGRRWSMSALAIALILISALFNALRSLFTKDWHDKLLLSAVWMTGHWFFQIFILFKKNICAPDKGANHQKRSKCIG